MKKGQVTMFIVLGLIIIIVISLGLYFSGALSQLEREKNIVESAQVLATSKNVQSFVEDCILDTSENVILEVLQNGGYYVLPQETVYYMHYNVPVYMIDEKDNAQTLSNIEKEIAFGIDNELNSCLRDFEDFNNVQVLGESETKVEINPLKVVLEVKLPLLIGEDIEAKLVRFRVDYDKEINYVYEEVKRAYDEVKGFKGIVPVSTLALLAEQKEYDFMFDNVGEVQIYVLRFNQVLIKEKPVEFSFGINNPLKEGEPIMFGDEDISFLLGLFPVADNEVEMNNTFDGLDFSI